MVHIEQAKQAILEQEDTDKNLQVTIEDKGPKTIILGTAKSEGYLKTPIHGNYMISSLLQELAIQSDLSAGSGHLVISEAQLRESPVERLLRMITTRFWPALVRRLDANGLRLAVADAKNQTGEQRPRIYVPFKDLLAQNYYSEIAYSLPELNMEVIVLPQEITPEYAQSIQSKPGLLSLSLTIIEDDEGHTDIQGTPFVVPGGRFNEMYGWDSYFCALGLLCQPDPTGYYLYLAKSMVDNLVYEINHYGKILNANRSYYLTRSQPPFLTSMVSAIQERINQVEMKISEGLLSPTSYFKLLISAKDSWLKRTYDAAIKEYRQVWMSTPRFVPQYGLSRYYDEGRGIPIETEASHYAVILDKYATKWELSMENFINAYNKGIVKELELDEYLVHDRALRESGHDTTYRFEGKAADLLTVDLNSLLYKYEIDIAKYLRDHCDGISIIANETETETEWLKQAEERKRRMYHLMWDSSKGMWFDYDFVEGRRSAYESVTTFWTMWAGLDNEADANRMVKKCLNLFEEPGGLVAGTERSRGPISLLRPNRQWDYPCGWAPHQMMAWKGLSDYGFVDDARRLAYRWLYMITKCFADYNAVVPEKFDVVARSHKVSAEYGNVGTDFKMVPKEGFGWMNASYQVGVSLLSRSEKRALGLLIPPEKLFTQSKQL